MGMNPLGRKLCQATVASNRALFKNFQSYSTKKPNSEAKLTEIPYQSKVANSINITGRVRLPVEFKTSPDGEYCASGTIIGKKQSSDSSLENFQIPVVFEGDLAHIAVCHLHKNDRVCLHGQFVAGSPPLDLMKDHEGLGNVYMLARSVSFVPE